jgi:hypothetical protein
MSADSSLGKAAEARSRWHTIDARLNPLRSVHAALTELRDTLVREQDKEEAVEMVRSSLEALGREEAGLAESLRFLTEPVFPNGRTLADEFNAGREIGPEATESLERLVAVGDGEADWQSVEEAVGEVLDREPIEEKAIGDLIVLFGIAVEAGIAGRERESEHLVEALQDAYDELSEPLPELEEQPIALLPIRLETRFVDGDGGRGFLEDDNDPEQLLVRVYPDQVHVDAHESELTEDEVEWGTYFWTVLWFARHPNPEVVEDANGYLEERIPVRRLRSVVERLAGDVSTGKFSGGHHDRYHELKERAWKKLLDRFGRERAAFVVHSLEPTDKELAVDLLTAPPKPPDDGDDRPLGRIVHKEEGQLIDREVERPDVIERPIEEELDVIEEPDDELHVEDPIEEELDVVEEPVEEDEDRTRPRTRVHASQARRIDPSERMRTRTGSRIVRDHRTERPAAGDAEATESDDEVTEELPELPALPERLSPLSFPEVPRRPESWTKSARAKLLPDRWVAIAEWEDAGSTSHRTAVAGEAIPDPLQVGPGLESVAEELLSETLESDSPAAEGTEWLVDFQEAENVGMALRLPLGALAGFDHRRGFDRLSVVGVKASMNASETPNALGDLLDAHHYTDGLSFVEQGTPTNNHDLPSGYSRADDPRETLEIECVPPKVESYDRSDGDLLARALAIDRGDGTDHVFANVANAGGTEQRDARHMNSALWPATLGYSLQHVLVDNKFVGNQSLWGNRDDEGGPTVNTQLLWLDAYRRHFIRYVRGRGPFPALRIGAHPYGILPTTAVETERDLSVLESSLLPDLLASRVNIEEIRDRGYDLEDLASGGIDPELLIEAGARSDAVIEAGAEPSHLVRGSTQEAIEVSQERITPPGLIRDGVGLTATSRLSRDRLAVVGIDTDRLASVGIAPGDLARGAVTDDRLAEAGVSIKQVAEAVLCDDARKLGITPEAMARARVAPTALLRGEFSDRDIEALGLDTRAVAEAVLPRNLKRAGVTPKILQDAGVSPRALVNGEVEDGTLEAAGIDFATVAETMLPDEVLAAGITSDRLSEAGVTVAELFNGTIADETLRSVGITTDALVPTGLREAGVTAAALEDVGVTPAAVLNGAVTPVDLEEAGFDPRTLAEAGVLPKVLTALGDGLGEFISAGLDTESLLSNGVTTRTLMDAGVDPETLIKAGLTREQFEAAGVDPSRSDEENETDGIESEPDLAAGTAATTGGDPTADALSEDVLYARSMTEDLKQAERELYRFSFDPATPREGLGPGSNSEIERTPERTASTRSVDEGGAEGSYGLVEDGGTRLVSPTLLDSFMRNRLRERVVGFGAHWSAAAAELPFGSDVDEDALIRLLKRTAVSSDVRHRTMVYSGEDHETEDPVGSEVADLFLPGHRRTVRNALERAGATDLDPRVGSLYPFDGDLTPQLDLDSGIPRFSHFQQFHGVVGSPHRGIVSPYDDVDANIDAFVDILLARSPRAIDQLGHPLDLWQDERITVHIPYAPSYPWVGIDFDVLDLSREEWAGLGMIGQRKWFVEEIETSDDPIGLVERMVAESRGTDKPTMMAENTADFGDSGALRSLLRILLQFGTLQAYITARRRIGAEFSDHPDGWPEPSLWTDDRGPLDALDDPVPPALALRPDVDPEMSYGDLLRIVAREGSSSTSIDPRTSEYADSLAYLRDRDPVSLAAAMHETLDLANHRLDAWWTSIATKDLLELREVQGTEGDGLDAMTWAGPDGDIQLRTVEPGLSGSFFGDSEGSEEFEGDDSQTIPDGGEEESDSPRRRARRRDHRTEDEERGSDEPSDDDTEEESDRPRQQVRARRGSSERVRDHRTEDEERGSDEPSAPVETQNEPKHDPDSLLRRAEDDPGLYVGGYGFVEELRPNLDEATGPEYIHTPSEGHATTAALLRSGLDAHAADEGGNIMGIDLSPERVRAGLWLIRGVRRGGSLGQLLGFRFERRLHEETLADAEELDREEVDLMRYLRAFRSAFPAIVDKIKRPDDPRGSDDGQKAELAGRDTVDGYRLVKRWDRYPFGRGDELPDPQGDATEYTVLDGIVEELRTAVRAAGDLLTAESVHQLGQGNFERAGGSIDALAKGEAFPDPTVVQTPRTNTGFPHRHCVLLDATEEPPRGTPRGRAEPAIATWVEHLLPDPDSVECRATIRWTDGDDEPRSTSTIVTLSELELGPLDTLYLFGSDAEGARAELESLLAYRLLRDPPEEGIPADSTVELAFAETEREEAMSVAAVLEFARSLRTLVQESRPVRADDLTHPSEERGPGHDEATLEVMEERAGAAWTGLYTWAEVLDERLALLDADHSIGDATAGLPRPHDGEPIGEDAGSDGGWEALGGDPLLHGPGATAARDEMDDRSRTVTGQVDWLAESVENAHKEIPLSNLGALSNSVNADELEGELHSLFESLPVGPCTRSAVREPVTARSSPDAIISGAVGRELADSEVLADNAGPDGSTAGTDIGSFLNRTASALNAPPSDSSPSDDDEIVAVTIWGSDGSGWFERETSASVDADGTFTASVDLSSVEPGTPFTVVAILESDGEIVYAADGRVVRDGPRDRPDPGEVLATRCPNLRRLLSILDASSVLDGKNAPLGALAAAIEAADWDRITEEREGMEPDGTVLTDADIAAVDALLALGNVDPEEFTSATLRLIDPVSRSGLHNLFLVAGENPDTDGSIRYMQRSTLTEVRARLYRLLEGPAPADDGHPSRLLAYDQRIARKLADRSDGVVVAAYLDAFLAASGSVIRYLSREDIEAIPLISGLTAWLYDPDVVKDPKTLATLVRNISASVDEYPALAALFEGLPSKGESSPIAEFASHLETVAELVEEGVEELPADNTAGTVPSDQSTVEELSSAIDELKRAIDGVVSEESVDEAFREGVLESLRGPMAAVARYGVLGATPRTPGGGTRDAERQLCEQARAVLRRVRGRLVEMVPPDKEDALEARVGAEVNRLETLFGDGFVVLPPFVPTNPGELRATFMSEDLVPGDRELAAETWLQRAAAVRDRIDHFREARTYGEVLTGTHARPLTIGQVPYEPGDTWVGVDGVDPLPGRLSVVAAFGPVLDPADVDGRMVGLFVDEWHESVPHETETTGVALHYDDPGNRAPNAVLLVPPPPDRSLTLSDLAAAIAETSEWARRRAVDYGDMNGIDHLLPGLYLPVAGARRRQPLVDLRMLDWYDWTAVDALLEPAFFRDQVVRSGGTETVLGGGGG